MLMSAILFILAMAVLMLVEIAGVGLNPSPSAIRQFTSPMQASTSTCTS